MVKLTQRRVKDGSNRSFSPLKVAIKFGSAPQVCRSCPRVAALVLLTYDTDALLPGLVCCDLREMF